MTASLSPPFPPQAMEQWQQQQQQAERAIRQSPWAKVMPALLQQTAAYSTPSARAGRLWEGQALILHGATNDPLEVEQFGLVVKLGRFICSQPGYSAVARANDPKCSRQPIARRLLADVKRLRQWMHANPPTAALWAPCCGDEGRRLALLLGLQVVEHRGATWAAWLPELAR
jgi:hypothetical protein